MAGRITPGPSANGLDGNFAASFVIASDGKPALAVVNTDGTTISGGGGGGTVAISQTTPGTTNNVSVSGSTGAGISTLIKDATAFGDGITSGILAIHPELYRTGTSDYARWPGDATSGAFVQLKGGTNGLALESGGNLATIATDVAPLVVSNAGGYVRQDSTATIAKESGGNLATIVTNTTGGATAANQTTMNSNLSSIVTNTGLGATAANQTNGSQQNKLTDGTNIANVVANDTGYNGVGINNTTKTVSFTTSSSGAQMLLVNTDCRGYGYISVVTTSVGSGLAWTGQFAPNSGGTYISGGSWQDDTSATGLPSGLGTSVNKIYSSTVASDFFQLNVTALTSGTLSGYIVLSSIPRPYHGLTINTGSATGSAVPANAFFVGIQNGSGNLQGISSANNTGDASTAIAVISTAASVYNGTTYDRVRVANSASATTGTGLLGAGILGFDGTNYQRVSVTTAGTIDTGLVPARTVLNTYSVHLTTNTTTTPTSSTAYVSSIIIAVQAAGTTSTVTIQDKQGTPLKIVSGFSTAALLSNGNDIYNFQVPAKMVSGIDIVTAGAAAATIDIWIGYYQ